MAGRTIVSTAVDDETLTRLDAFCSSVHRKRAEVLRGLLYSLLVEDKQFIFDEWRGQVMRVRSIESEL